MSRVQDFPSIRNSEVFKTFANRFARFAYLKHVCDDGHPVLEVERELLEMSKSKLQEHLFTNVQNDQRPIYRPLLESWIRAIANERIFNSDADDSVKIKAMDFIRLETLSDLFPQVH